MNTNGAIAAPVAILDGVVKRYGKRTVVANLNLCVGRGELLAVLGPNGAGKTTAISMWLGVIDPDGGRASVLGRPSSDRVAHRGIGIMLQDVSQPPELRPREIIDLTRSYYPNPLGLEETLRLTDIESLADTRYGKLSGGQKRQVQFAAAICGRPQMLFLDEPTVGLDVEARHRMWQIIRMLLRDGCSIVLTTHYIEEAEALADRVAVLVGGSLVAQGTPHEVRSLVAQQRISCESQLGAHEVQGWPGVVAAVREGTELKITAVDVEDVVRRLLAADHKVGRLQVAQATLAEAFTKLTQEAE